MLFKLSLALACFKLFHNLSFVNSKHEPSWKDCPSDEVKKLIDCSDFGLTKIPLDIYDSSWQHIRLGRNPFNCDCSMNTFLNAKRFPEFLKRTTDLKTATCNEPANFKGLEVLKLADRPTFCKHTSTDRTTSEEDDFWSFFQLNTRSIAAIVLLSLLLILASTALLRRCKKEDYLSQELLPSYSRDRRRCPCFLSKLFSGTQYNVVTLNESTELTEDEIIYENLK